MNDDFSHLIEILKQGGAAGVWLLNGAAPFISYDSSAPHTDDGFAGMCELEALWQAGDVDQRALDLREAGRVLIVRFPDLDERASAGLTTLDPTWGYCRVCGCSQLNACETDAGSCGWIEPDLCSACISEVNE